MPENPRIEELKRRVQSDPASIAFAALAEEFRRVGRYEESIEACRTGLQRHPAYLSARVTLGRALIEMGEYDAAREELETVLRSAPENLAAIRGLAQINERLGYSTEMDPAFAAALRHQAAAVPPPPTPAPSAVEGPAPETPPPRETIPLSTGPIRVSTIAPPVVAAEPLADADPVADRLEPDAHDGAAIARLERFLSAIQAARHA